jgi:hypothetical protein
MTQVLTPASSEDYWVVSDAAPCVRIMSCRACHKTISVGAPTIFREGRKMRFAYHGWCFEGTADPRSQPGSSFSDPRWSDSKSTAPNISALSGPRAKLDSQGRPLGRSLLKPEAPKHLGSGKWQVERRGYNPNLSTRGYTKKQQATMALIVARNSTSKKPKQTAAAEVPAATAAAAARKAKNAYENALF